MKNTLNRFPLIKDKLLTIGEIPTSYLVSMTYEEQLLWLCNYLEKTLLPKMNEVIKEFNLLEDEVNATYEYITNNLQQIASEILDELIKEGKLIVSLGMKYTEDNEELEFYIDSTYSSELVEELSTLTTPESEG